MSLLPAAVGRTSTVAAGFADPHHARIIYAVASGLLLLGVLMIVATVWWWRSAGVEHPSLAPLEVMTDRSWLKASDGEQRRRLDGVRPASLASGEVPPPVAEVDLSALERSEPTAFDDLRDGAGVAAVAIEPVAATGEGSADVDADADAEAEAGVPPAPGVDDTGEKPHAPRKHKVFDPLLQHDSAD
jgi:hypothetical protein